jgi:hypothetical protein
MKSLITTIINPIHSKLNFIEKRKHTRRETTYITIPTIDGFSPNGEEAYAPRYYLRFKYHEMHFSVSTLFNYK